MKDFTTWLIEALSPTLDPEEMKKFAKQIVAIAKDFVQKKINPDNHSVSDTRHQSYEIKFLDFNKEEKNAIIDLNLSFSRWNKGDKKLGTEFFTFSGRSTVDQYDRRTVRINLAFNEKFFDRPESPKYPEGGEHGWGFEDDEEENEEFTKKYNQYKQQKIQHSHSEKILDSLALKKFRQEEQHLTKQMLFVLTHELGHSQRPFGKRTTGREDNYDVIRKKGWNRYQAHPREVEANLSAVKSKYMSIPENARKNLTFAQLLKASLNGDVVQVYLRSPEAIKKLMKRFKREGIYTIDNH